MSGLGQRCESETSELVGRARRIAKHLLSDALPRRWFHTIGVARTADVLARALVPPQWADDIVAAAWLHDIGYAPALIDTGFHPLDGAAYLMRNDPQTWRHVAGLVAHHSGAVFEARERGLEDGMSRYRLPADVAMLAILTTADLCTAPNGTPVDPGARIAEVLDRYTVDDPVHRAIMKSARLLTSQAALILGAVAAAQYAQPSVPLPDSVECVGPGGQLQAVWAGEHHRIAVRLGANSDISSGVEVCLRNPPKWWCPADAEFFAGELSAAADAAAGKTLGWSQYRVLVEPGSVAADRDRGARECALALGSTTTFFFDDIVACHVDLVAKGGSYTVQQRTFHSVTDITDWSDIAREVPASALRRDRTAPVGAGPEVRTQGFRCSPERFMPWDQFEGGCGEEPSIIRG